MLPAKRNAASLLGRSNKDRETTQTGLAFRRRRERPTIVFGGGNYQMKRFIDSIIAFLFSKAGVAGPFNGPGGGEVAVDHANISEVNGPGNWTIWGFGQNVTLRLKDGDGSLTLRGFKNIAIAEKNGAGNLVIEEDNNGTVAIGKLDGPGHSYLRVKSKKTIADKNGEGNIYFKHSPPVVEKIDGPGKVIRET